MEAAISRGVCRTLAVGTAIGFAGFFAGVCSAQEGESELIGERRSRSTSAQANAASGPAPTPAGIEDIVVTARRSSESAQRVPIAMTALSAQTLEDLSIRDVLEIQKVTPGLFVSSAEVSGRAKLTIRGQSETDDKITADGSVGVYIDGANYGGGQYGLRSSLLDVERIEVLKGPQGTLFGKNTTGGALNITTRHPTYEWGGYVDLLYGSYNNAQALVAANVPVAEDRLALRFVGQVITREGYYREAFNRASNVDNTLTGRIQLRADPSDNVSILLSGEYVQARNTEAHIVLTNDSLLASSSATLFLGTAATELGLNPASAADRMKAYSVWRGYYDAYQDRSSRRGYSDTLQPRDDVDMHSLSANISVDIGALTAKSITSYRHLSRHFNLDGDGTPFDFIYQRSATKSDYVGQEFQLIESDGAGLDWQAGLFFDRKTGTEYTASDIAIFTNPARSVISEVDVKNSSWAAYAQAVYHLGPQLRVTGGLRYTRDRREMDAKNRRDLAVAVPPLPAGGASRCNLLAPAAGGPTFPACSYEVTAKFNRYTWLASVDWRPVDRVMLYGTVSTGYRSGGFSIPGSDQYATIAARDAAFTPYKPETVTNYEVGFKSDLLDRRLRLNGSLFYQDYRDIQQRIRDSVNGLLVTLIRNAARARIYGGELEITARPTTQLTLGGSLSYLNARFKEYRALDAAGNLLDLTGQPFAAPEWTFSGSVDYEVPLRDGSLGLHLNYAWTDDVVHAPGTPDVASVTQRAYGLLDGRVSWSIDSQDLEISVFGKNLTDKRYFSSLVNVQSSGFNFGFAAAPRTFGIQARKTF
ncbi:TonB-dependent receptor [Sphingobium fuliginis]|nr:TonB-dependent receptor [Sphingobium fuliginis]